MILKNILTGLVDCKESGLLNDGTNDWEASVLPESLSLPMLKRSAYLQAGLYIAEIDNRGYLGHVLYKVK